MASSIPVTTKSVDRGRTHGQQNRVDLQRVQNVLLIWLDNSAKDNNDACRNTVNAVHTFIDGEQCIEFIKTIKNNKVCMVISGSLGQQVVPRVHGMCQVDAIFIYSNGDKKRHEQWVTDWPKIKGVFTEITPLCAALRQAAQRCEHNATPMSFVTSDATVDRLDPSFMYTQILKEILRTIHFNDQHVQAYVDYCREIFQDNAEQLEHIKQVEQHYHARTPIWWYTRECFLYPMLNRALRTMDGDIMIRMGFFINDLHRHVEREHQQQYGRRSSSDIFTVYRGQGLSQADFEQLTKTKGGLMSFNCFLSTSKRRSVSLQFAERAACDLDLMGILFRMTIDPSQSTTPFAAIDKLSAIEGEDEVLFAMHSVFRVHDMEIVDGNNRLYEVHLLLTSDNDSELHVLTDRIREECFPGESGWYRLALVLDKMGQLEKAEEIYETLLNREMSDIKRATLYNRLGLIKYNRGEYATAIELYQKNVLLSQQSLPPTHPHLAASYNNIGMAYYSLGDYSKSLVSYEKALAIQRQSLPANHPDLAMTYSTIGNAHHSLGDHPKALASLERALAIRKHSLPSIHPDLATSYNNIGGVYYSMGDHTKALTSYEHALAIRKQSLPPTHTDLATSHNNIGGVYYSMNGYAKALASYEQALVIRQKSLPSTHPDLAASYNNIGLVYFSMGDYPKALSYYEKDLAITRQSLPPTHPSLAISYNNIGLAYDSMDEHPKALAAYEKALVIRQQSLPSTHPDLAASYYNIGLLYEKMGDYSKACSVLERALHVAEQSLPLEPAHLEMIRKSLADVKRKL